MGLIEKILLAYVRLRIAFSPKKSAFKIGDAVILKDGSGYPMLVKEINRVSGKTELLCYCQWYDPKTKETRSNFFHESKLQHYDWKKNLR